MAPAGSFVIDAGHPALPGHFPGRPIVPGVMLLDEVTALLARPGQRVSGFPMVRFLQPVRPGQRVDVAGEAGRFAGSVAGTLVIQGSIEWTAG